MRGGWLVHGEILAIVEGVADVHQEVVGSGTAILLRVRPLRGDVLVLRRRLLRGRGWGGADFFAKKIPFLFCEDICVRMGKMKED